jgi:hypothetical protein
LAEIPKVDLSNIKISVKHHSVTFNGTNFTKKKSPREDNPFACQEIERFLCNQKVQKNPITVPIAWQ